MRRGLRTLAVLLILVLVGGGLAFAGGEKEKAGGAVAGQSTLELAKKYANAKPGESFTVGMITWWLGQEYAIMVYQAVEQAAKQMGLKFRGAVASTESEWIEITESMIAGGAKAIICNVPNMAVMKQMSEICNENNVFLATYFGYTGDIMPGDFGPRWVIDNTPFSDEQTFIPLTLLMQKMKDANKTRLLIQQASKSAATVSTVYINLGIFQALQKYPDMKLVGFQYGEWGYEPGRAAAEAALAISTNYEGFWGANDGQTMGGLKALKDRGVDIGAFSASRDMELTTAQEILKGNFLCTSGFAIPYFGGRLVPMLYDMCVGAWYPSPEEMLQTGTLDLYGRPGELEALAKEAGIDKHPSFNTGPLKENMEQILAQMKATPPNYPYDFRLLSLSKTKELGLTYDKHAGGGTFLGSHDYYFPAMMEKFGSKEALRKHVAALHKYFLDISWMTDLKAAKEYAKQLPPEVKLTPIWK
jgi:ABC-type sugar transport system substrate-binding protein